jgi:hypothetical protein
MRKNIWNLAFSVWHGAFLLNTMVYNFIHVFENHGFLLFIFSVDRPIRCFYFGATVNNAIINMKVQLSLQHSDFISLPVYTEVRLLDHMMALLLIFFRNCLTVFHNSYTSLPYHQFCFYTSLPALVLLSPFLIIIILIGLSHCGYIIVHFISFFLMISDVELFLYTHWLFLYLLLRNV